MTITTEIQQHPLWKKLKEKRVPLSFTLELTARCNLNCRHCYINLPATDSNSHEIELNKDTILEIGRQAVALGAVWCLLTGGEPLLRKDFSDIYLGIKRLGLLVSVFTNGALLRKEHVELFTAFPPRDIEITVYGVTKETYERVTRRQGSFAEFRVGLDLLLAAGLPIRLKAMALRSNLHELEEISRFCRERTKDFFRIDPQLHLRYDGNPRRNAEIRRERLSPDEIVALEVADVERMRAMRSNCAKLTAFKPNDHDPHRLFRCGAGNDSFNVGYDGRFRLCSSLCAAETTCDLKTTTLATAWKTFVPSVRKMQSMASEFSKTCRQCPMINLCLWCPAHAHLETGRLDAKVDYFCEVTHKRAENIKNQLDPANTAHLNETRLKPWG